MTQLDFLDKSKNTKAYRVEAALRNGGWDGVSNVALNNISFRYSAIIHRLREEGHIIETGPTDKYGKVIFKWIK
jgi:hypothetical protein